MTKPPPDLSDYEEETVPFDDVMRQLLAAKPAPKVAPTPPPEPDE